MAGIGDRRDGQAMLDYAQARRMMVDCQLRTFDVNDNAVLDAFDSVERERFVPKGREAFAYSDQSQRIDESADDPRVLPAPMVLARLIQALKLRPGARVLDVAAGYGYASAVMVRLGVVVTALETSRFVKPARERLAGAADVVEGGLADGATAHAPYDAILINGRVEVRPKVLLEQLKDDGRLVCVYGPHRRSQATIFVRAGDAFGARPLFDASMPALAPFRAEAGFAF